MIAEATTPTADDVTTAFESSRRLARLMTSQTESFQMRIESADGQAEIISVPATAVRLLADALSEMARGNAVRLMPAYEELTTQQAADVLNVSRPFLIGLLESRQIPFHKVGTHRRIRVADLMAYKQRDDVERERAADELSAEAQDLGLGY